MTEATPSIDWLTQALIHLLDVADGGKEDHFVGARRPGGEGRVFGGQVVGQALMAATKTVPADRLVHSLHCYFMRPGSEEFEIDYQVDADMDGRAFSNRRVVARQGGKAIFNMAASFHLPEPGFAHRHEMPDVPEPESLPNMRELVNSNSIVAGPVTRRMATRPSPIEIRPVLPADPGGGRTTAEAWMRIGSGPLGIPQTVQRAVLAFTSDLLLLATAYQPHGLHIGGPEVTAASIDHSLWFHEDVECGDWLLYATESPWAGHGRGLARGHFFNRDGVLVASVAQEGLMRLRHQESKVS